MAPSVHHVLHHIAFVGFGMMLTRVAKDAENRTAAAVNAFMFPMMFLSGTFFPCRDDAGVPSKVRQGSASLLCERGASGVDGIRGRHGCTEERRNHRGLRRRGVHRGYTDHQLGRGQLIAECPLMCSRWWATQRSRARVSTTHAKQANTPTPERSGASGSAPERIEKARLRSRIAQRAEQSGTRRCTTSRISQRVLAWSGVSL